MVVVAACSGGDDDDAAATTTEPAVETTEATVETTDAPTTEPATTESTTTTTMEPTTTTEAVIARMPLTGVPLAFGQTVPDRPALAVKIDNVECAHRTQVGLNLADIVFEEIVEGRLTRFAAIFHSQSADPVGPIRSGRSQDVDMLGGLNRPLLAWSGGNPGVNRAIAESDLIDLSSQRGASGYYRGRNCSAPHNLFNTTDDLWAQAPPEAGRPTALFQYLNPDEVAAGPDTSWAQLMVGIRAVRWDWDPASGTYLRQEGGRPHVLADGEQVSTNNVVVLVNEYRPTPWNAISPEAVSVGTGDAYVFTGGKLQVGTWSRADRTSPISLTTPEGAVIELTPGRTFVEMADVLDHGTVSG
ncbi:MAG: DUF3048 domain-containing protein [Ilumatobacteraceae bacterium]